MYNDTVITNKTINAHAKIRHINAHDIYKNNNKINAHG